MAEETAQKTARPLVFITKRHICLADLPKCAITTITSPRRVCFPKWHILGIYRIDIFHLGCRMFRFAINIFEGRYYCSNHIFSSTTSALKAAYTWIKEDIGHQLNCSLIDN